jgi:hypothetical protein
MTTLVTINNVLLLLERIGRIRPELLSLLGDGIDMSVDRLMRNTDKYIRSGKMPEDAAPPDLVEDYEYIIKMLF